MRSSSGSSCSISSRKATDLAGSPHAHTWPSRMLLLLLAANKMNAIVRILLHAQAILVVRACFPLLMLERKSHPLYGFPQTRLPNTVDVEKTNPKHIHLKKNMRKTKI